MGIKIRREGQSAARVGVGSTIEGRQPEPYEKEGGCRPHGLRCRSYIDVKAESWGRANRVTTIFAGAPMKAQNAGKRGTASRDICVIVNLEQRKAEEKE